MTFKGGGGWFKRKNNLKIVQEWNMENLTSSQKSFMYTQ